MLENDKKKRLGKNYEGNEMRVLKSAHQESGFFKLVAGCASMGRKTQQQIDLQLVRMKKHLSSFSITDRHSKIP